MIRTRFETLKNQSEKIIICYIDRSLLIFLYNLLIVELKEMAHEKNQLVWFQTNL